MQHVIASVKSRFVRQKVTSTGTSDNVNVAVTDEDVAPLHKSVEQHFVSPHSVARGRQFGRQLRDTMNPPSLDRCCNFR